MPPPIPRTAERKPITDPAKIDLFLFGWILLDEKLKSNSICIPTTIINIAMDIFKNNPFIWTAKKAPAKAPNIIPIATGLKWSKSIEFFFLWAFADDKPVKIIHDIAVPIARWTIMLSSKPKLIKEE